jgi:hypothetical protein
MSALCEFYAGLCPMVAIQFCFARRLAMFKRWAVLLAVPALFLMVETHVAAQIATTPKAQDKVAKGEPEVRQMLPLMDQDKQGKVSREDFMKFMAAEFDRLDKKNEGKLDVKELTQPPLQPTKGFHK